MNAKTTSTSMSRFPSLRSGRRVRGANNRPLASLVVTCNRRGFTLWEMATVLLILAITATLAAPAFVRLGQDKSLTSADLLMKLLHDTRAVAIQYAVETTLVIDPKSGHYRVDTTSTAGSGPVAEDTLHFGATEVLETDLPRLRYIFRPTGAAFADSVIVRGADTTRLVTVDAWSGVAYAKAR